MPKSRSNAARRKRAPSAKVAREHSKRSAAARRGHATRKRREAALKSARDVFAAGRFDHGWTHDQPGWEPEGGWQGDDQDPEGISYMTHEEKIEWLEWLAEELDTTISELFEMMGSS